ncbi:MAG: type II toxin-antitoxin system VapC family toxin [Candidatus Hydrothermarchaeales archaeon]
MRFVDTNIFIYALLKPKRKLTQAEGQIKEKAKNIFRRIDRGEEVLTSVVHLSEIANFLENAVNQTFALEFVRDLMTKPNITVVDVGRGEYMAALFLAEDKASRANDALAYITMLDRDVKEIYSFDKHLDNFPVVRIID